MAIPKKHSQDNDINFPDAPSDGISSLSANGSVTSPSTIVIAGCWDNSVYCYEIQYGPGGQVSGIVKRGQMQHEAPVLCTDIGSDNVTTYSAGCDGKVRMWNPAAGQQSTVVGNHDQPVRNMKFIPESNLLVTGSWDRTVRIWDLRSPTAAATLNVGERVYAMDAKQQAIVVGTADKKVHVFDIANSGAKVAEFNSSLNYQTRCISIFADNSGFAMGCIEGRVAIEYFSEMNAKMQQQRAAPGAPKPQTKNFAFKCHRDAADVFVVNAIDFHRYNTFCTAGSDGVFCWWDKDARQRLAIYEKFKRQIPITSVKFSPRGDQMFYALSYDWSRGAENNNPSLGNSIVLHPVVESEIQPKNAATTSSWGKK